MLGYKITLHNGTASHGGIGKWRLPVQRKDGTWKPGQWMPPVRDTLICERGYHYVPRPYMIPYFLLHHSHVLWRLQTDDRYKHEHAYEKSAAGRARLLYPIPFDAREQALLVLRIIDRYEFSYRQVMGPDHEGLRVALDVLYPIIDAGGRVDLDARKSVERAIADALRVASQPFLSRLMNVVYAVMDYENGTALYEVSTNLWDQLFHWRVQSLALANHSRNFAIVGAHEFVHKENRWLDDEFLAIFHRLVRREDVWHGV